MSLKELVIEWLHYGKEGETCDRCAATGSSVREAVAGLADELAQRGITVRLIETALPEEAMAQSNLILFNGAPLEELLESATAGENPCPSCSCLTGSETSCRTVSFQGRTYEEIPEELVKKAAYRALKLDRGE